MPGPLIDRDAVARLAELAQLALGEDELSRVTRELRAILAYADELALVDVEGVAPMDRPFADPEPGLREDQPGLEIARDIALGQAPRAHDGGFDVPGFVDEG